METLSFNDMTYLGTFVLLEADYLSLTALIVLTYFIAKAVKIGDKEGGSGPVFYSLLLAGLCAGYHS